MIAAALVLTFAQLPPVSGIPSLPRGDTCLRTGDRCQTSRNSRPVGGLAFFEFAPASGAGMGSACACAAITGARGEAVTFTRTGSATCSRQGLATTGIVNGDLVTCATDQPRVEPIGGALGVRVENSKTNQAIRSREFENAGVWQCNASGVACPVVTADVATAPDGTLTADRLDFPALAASQFSQIYQTGLSANSVSNTGTVYVRGVSGSGTILLSIADATPNFSTCAYTSTSWTRCQHTGTKGVGVAADHAFGVEFAATGASAQSVFVWGFQAEQSASYASSYIYTTSAAVTRNDETVFRDETQFGALLGGAGGSVAATAQCLNTANRRIVTLATSGGSPNVEWDVNFPAGAVAVTQWFTGAASTFTSTLAIDSVSRRWAQFTAGAGSTLNICRDGACQAGGSRGANQSGATSLRIHVGNYVSGAFRCDGIITGVCVDPSPSRCR